MKPLRRAAAPFSMRLLSLIAGWVLLGGSLVGKTYAQTANEGAAGFDADSIDTTAFPVFELPAAKQEMGAEAWYYEAKKLEQKEAQDPSLASMIDFMYFLAFHFGEKDAAKEAGFALIGRASKTAAAPERAREIALQWMDFFGADFNIYKTIIVSWLDSGEPDEALKALAALRSALPSAAKSRANELAFYEYSAKAAKNDFSWINAASSYLKLSVPDAWAAKTLRLAAASPGMGEEMKALALMRADYAEKQYGAAAADAAGAFRLLHAPGTSRFLISEAGRSFINSGAKDEGVAFFMGYFPEAQGAAAAALELPEAVIASLKAQKQQEGLWVAAYYLARLWLSSGKEREAAILFLALTESAPSGADADGALWYWLDITMRRIAGEDVAAFDAEEKAAAPSPDPVAQELSKTFADPRRALELGALAEAAARWKNPEYFDDIVEAYNRSLLKGKFWDDAFSLFILIDEKTSAGMRTKLMYQSARLVEEKLARRAQEERPQEDLPREYYSAILANPNAEEYYRTMSAWRLGSEPPYLQAMPRLQQTALSAASGAAAAAPGAAANSESVQAALSLIKNYLSYDLDEMASALALRYIGSLDKSLIASLAFQLSAEGQHYAALRLARDAVNRGSGSLYPELYGLVYPKAWNDIVAQGAAIPGIPEALAYGIIRSESVFDPAAVSYAGAVGLAQLMPATAAETAKGLKMASYSLTDPADNVRIGFTYYSYMLSRFGGKPMRAMFAYNAGPTRMAGWAKESGELPDDILLETLHLAQPRQYAKNIIQATLAYGKIHYGIAPAAMLDYLVNAAPLPAAKQETQAAPAPAAPPTPAVNGGAAAGTDSEKPANAQEAPKPAESSIQGITPEQDAGLPQDPAQKTAP